MTSLNKMKLDDFTEIINALQNTEITRNTCEEFKKLSNLQNFSSLKDSLTILTVISDNKHASLQNLKDACTKIQNGLIRPILEELVQAPKSSAINEGQEDPDAPKKAIQAKFLSKWWVSYLSLLDESFQAKQMQWGSNLVEWVTNEELELLEQTLKVLEDFYFLKIDLMKAIMQMEILGNFLKPSQDSFFEQIKSVLQKNVENGIQNAKLSTENSMSIEFRVNILQNLLSYFTSSPEDFQKTLKSSIISGRFDKKEFPKLTHSLIVGHDGGIYALLNTVSQQEIEMLIGTGQVEIDRKSVV